jgi:hypothetical protein
VITTACCAVTCYKWGYRAAAVLPGGQQQHQGTWDQRDKLLLGRRNGRPPARGRRQLSRGAARPEVVHRHYGVEWTGYIVKERIMLQEIFYNRPSSPLPASDSYLRIQSELGNPILKFGPRNVRPQERCFVRGQRNFVSRILYHMNWSSTSWFH